MTFYHNPRPEHVRELPHFLTAPHSLFILTQTDEATAPSDSFKVESSLYFAPNSRPLLPLNS